MKVFYLFMYVFVCLFVVGNNLNVFELLMLEIMLDYIIISICLY